MSNNVINTQVIKNGVVIATLTAGGIGPTGSQGPPGQGVASGGASRTILSKKTATDYDTEWRPESFSQSFINQVQVTATHNLGRKPTVAVHDSTGGEVEGDITHLSINELLLTFSSSFTGVVICS